VCSANIEQATGNTIEDAKPVAGDFCLCLECESPLRYTATMALQVIPQEELRTLPVEHQLMILSAVITAQGVKRAERKVT
jgi:hypothetical protein